MLDFAHIIDPLQKIVFLRREFDGDFGISGPRLAASRSTSKQERGGREHARG